MPAPTLIRRILRVDHAGEHGAVAIYEAQLSHARRVHPGLAPWLEETLTHEQRHRTRFRAAMDARGVTPCGALSVWSIGGATLGAITAAFGATGIYACTAAVERTVHRHLVEQADYPDRAEPELAALVRDILVEEVQHLDHAETRHDQNTLFARALSAIVAGSTEMLIWLSTQGSSFSLKRDMDA